MQQLLFTYDNAIIYFRFMKKAVFLDRDGVVNELVYFPEQGIVDNPLNASQVKLVFGIDQLIKVSKKLGYLNIVISNQPTIGLNKLKNIDFKKVDIKIKYLLKKSGANIDAWYYCFHHPFAKLEKYKKTCSCRKPKTGLFKEAANDFNIALTNSWIIGDGVDDIKAGKKAGCKTILMANINSSENLRIIEKQLGNIKPDFLIKKLPEAIEILRETV